MGTNISLNTESFAFLSSCFKMNEWCKACTTALALRDQTCNSLSCLPSLVSTTPRYLKFSTCFNDTSPTCRKHWTGFFKRYRTSVLEVLIFILAMSHAAAKPFNVCWSLDSDKARKTKLSAKSIRCPSVLYSCSILQSLSQRNPVVCLF